MVKLEPELDRYCDFDEYLLNHISCLYELAEHIDPDPSDGFYTNVRPST